MKLINYRTFRSNKEFVEWQMETETPPLISQIQPWVSSIMMHGVEEGGYADEKIRTDIDGDTECGCFIVYITEE